MDARIAASAAPDRLSAQLLGSFAGLALLLSAVGVGGVVAFTTARRTPELAIRMALGASPWQAVSRLIADSFRMCFVGLGAGIVAAFLLAPALSKVLFGIGPRDVWTFAGTGGLLLVVALVACWLPARRALSIDPVSALRAE
jgi:ABC-type antimicrobial peptide transport system permease subunit